MSKPMLSICIPTFNRASLLSETLSHLSFIKDIDIPIEVIVSDNASTDETEDVVHRMSERLPSLRYFRQQTHVGMLPNHASAYRMASGEYVTYLADDDRLVPDPLLDLIRYLNDRQDIVVCFTSWHDWDAKDKKPVAEWNRCGDITLFDKSRTYELFNFIMKYHIFPEIAIYRTNIFHKILFLPHKTWAPHWWMCNFLKYGTICFHPKIFYRNTVRFESGEINKQRHGNKLAVTILDEYRAAAEFVLFNALRENGIFCVPKSMRGTALDLINNFANERLFVAGRLSFGQRDFISSIEFFSRYLIWSSKRKIDISTLERDVIPLAAAQATVEVFENTTNMKRFIVCDFFEPERIVGILRTVKKDLLIQVVSLQEMCRKMGRRDFLVLVEKVETRETLISKGMPSGRVLCFKEVCECFRVEPTGELV